MAEKASLAKFKAIQHKLTTAQKRIARIRETADEKVEVFIRTAETGGAAMLGGVIIGKGGNDDTSFANNVFGIPTTLGVGLALHTAGLAGIGGKNRNHLHAIGDGFLCAYLTQFGMQVGTGVRKGASIKDSVTKALEKGGVPDTTNGMRLSADDLAALQEASK